MKHYQQNTSNRINQLDGVMELIADQQWIEDRGNTMSSLTYDALKGALSELGPDYAPLLDELKANSNHQHTSDSKQHAVFNFLQAFKEGLAINVAIAKEYLEELLQPCAMQPVFAVRNSQHTTKDNRKPSDWILSHIAADEGLPIELSLRTDRPENAVQYFTIIGVMDSFLTSEVDPTVESTLSQDSVRELWSGAIDGSLDQPRAVLSFELPEGICLVDQQPEGRELKKENGHWLLALRLTHKK